ncbi:3'-5' exonuclease [Mitsuokella sp. WILCCON 0060]|uniref:3'-5' exonuclease n=1 Tax=Mitsuokella sp. WILCCON 0060 TaxID=3345341 RepID=UPI003F1D15FD
MQKIEDEKSYFQIQRDMNQYLIELRQKILAKVDIKKLSDSIIGFVGEGNIRSNYPEYNHGNYLTEIKDKFIKLFIDELQKQDNVLRALQNFRGENTIPIMTIHKSKGLEYRIVYFVGLEDETFWNFSKHKQEDRCAFFVALSRAKEEVVFTSCLLRHNMRDLTRSRRKIREFFDLLMQCRGIEYINFSSEKLLSTVDSPKHQ